MPGADNLAEALNKKQNEKNKEDNEEDDPNAILEQLKNM